MSSFGLRGGTKLPGMLGAFGVNGEAALRKLEPQVRAYAELHEVEATFGSGMKRNNGGELGVTFHPAASDIRFTVQQGYIVMTAETFQAGPGYHAFIAGLVDYLSQRHQWVWDFDNSAKRFFDDTGYYRSRDFPTLQTAMAGEFGRMCQTVLAAESPDGIPRHVALRLPFTLASDHFAATSLGFRDRAFFEQPNPERFFPWWEEGLTAQTLKNLALCKMWNDIFWQPHDRDPDRKDAKTGQRLIDLAREHGAQFDPDEGVDDIAALLRGEPSDMDGGGGRIGYWRQDMWHEAPGGWVVPLPAFYHRELSEGGRLCELTYGGRMVHIRTLSHREDRPLEWAGPPQEGWTERLRFETGQYRAVVYTPPQDDDDGDTSQLWAAIFNTRNGSALINVVFRDKQDTVWAEKVLRSVRPGLADSVAIEPLS